MDLFFTRGRQGSRPKVLDKSFTIHVKENSLKLYDQAYVFYMKSTMALLSCRLERISTRLANVHSISSHGNTDYRRWTTNSTIAVGR